MLYLWSLSVGALPRKYSFKNMLWCVLITIFWLDGDLVYGNGSDHTYWRSWHLLGDSSLPLDHSVPGCSGSDLLLTLSVLWCRLQTQELWASWRSAESCWVPPPSTSLPPPAMFSRSPPRNILLSHMSLFLFLNSECFGPKHKMGLCY